MNDGYNTLLVVPLLGIGVALINMRILREDLRWARRTLSWQQFLIKRIGDALGDASKLSQVTEQAERDWDAGKERK